MPGTQMGPLVLVRVKRPKIEVSWGSRRMYIFFVGRDL